jgi:hypothetical protein
VIVAEYVEELLQDPRRQNFDPELAHALKRQCVTSDRKVFKDEVSLCIGRRILRLREWLAPQDCGRIFFSVQRLQ